MVPVVVSEPVIVVVVPVVPCVLVARVVALEVLLVLVPGELVELEVLVVVVPVIPWVLAVALAVPAEVGLEVVLAPELWVVVALPPSEVVSVGRSVQALRVRPRPRIVEARASAQV